MLALALPLTHRYGDVLVYAEIDNVLSRNVTNLLSYKRSNARLACQEAISSYSSHKPHCRCEKCLKTFLSLKDLRKHKQEIHSY